MDDNKVISLKLLELFSSKQDKFNKKIFSRFKKIDSLEEIGIPEDNVLYIVEEEFEDAEDFTIPDGSISEIKLDENLRAKLSLLETAAEELEKI